MNKEYNCDLSGARVLFLSYFFPPSGLPGAHRVVKFLRNLENGHLFVLTVTPDSYPPHVDINSGISPPIAEEAIFRTSVVDPFKRLLKMRSLLTRGGGAEPAEKPAAAQTAARSSLSQPSSLQSLKDFVYEVMHFPDEAFHWVIPSLRAACSLIRREKIDVIFASGMPWSGLVFASLLHRLTGVPYIADFRDPWIANPYHPARRFGFGRIEAALERTTVCHAAAVSANTEQLRDEFLHRYPHLPAERFLVLPNGYDLSDFGAIDAEPRSAGDAALVLAHAGHLYSRRDPTPLVEALESLPVSGGGAVSGIRFCQIGQVDLQYDFEERFRRLIEEGTIEKVPQLPHHDCLVRLAQSDVLVIIQPATKTQIPSKLYDYLCLNRPILAITPLDGALGQMMRRYEFGAVHDPSDICGIARRLEEYRREKSARGVIRADYPARSNFDVRGVTAQLAAVIRRLTTIPG